MERSLVYHATARYIFPSNERYLHSFPPFLLTNHPHHPLPPGRYDGKRYIAHIREQGNVINRHLDWRHTAHMQSRPRKRTKKNGEISGIPHHRTIHIPSNERYLHSFPPFLLPNHPHHPIPPGRYDGKRHLAHIREQGNIINRHLDWRHICKAGQEKGRKEYPSSRLEAHGTYVKQGKKKDEKEWRDLWYTTPPHDTYSFERKIPPLIPALSFAEPPTPSDSPRSV